MVEETGIVTRVDGSTATVMVQKKSACEGCTAQGACHATPEGMEITALNPVHAAVGQRVKVVMQGGAYLKGSVMVYGLPLLLFIVGAFAGKKVGEAYFPDMNSDLAAALTAFAVLVLSLAGVRVWSKSAEASTDYQPVVERVITGTGKMHND